MSVRLTERIIGEVVIAKGLPKGPQMVVQGIDEEAKLVVTAWFSDQNEYQEGAFPPKALEKVEPPAAKAKKALPAKKGKKAK